ncbi:unnamed protein product [Boreogadus saida]
MIPGIIIPRWSCWLSPTQTRKRSEEKGQARGTSLTSAAPGFKPPGCLSRCGRHAFGEVGTPSHSERRESSSREWDLLPSPLGCTDALFQAPFLLGCMRFSSHSRVQWMLKHDADWISAPVRPRMLLCSSPQVQSGDARSACPHQPECESHGHGHAPRTQARLETTRRGVTEGGLAVLPRRRPQVELLLHPGEGMVKRQSPICFGGSDEVSHPGHMSTELTPSDSASR